MKIKKNEKGRYYDAEKEELRDWYTVLAVGIVCVIGATLKLIFIGA